MHNSNKFFFTYKTSILASYRSESLSIHSFRLKEYASSHKLKNDILPVENAENI